MVCSIRTESLHSRLSDVGVEKKCLTPQLQLLCSKTSNRHKLIHLWTQCAVQARHHTLDIIASAIKRLNRRHDVPYSIFRSNERHRSLNHRAQKVPPSPISTFTSFEVVSFQDISVETSRSAELWCSSGPKNSFDEPAYLTMPRNTSNFRLPPRTDLVRPNKVHFFQVAQDRTIQVSSHRWCACHPRLISRTASRCLDLSVVVMRRGVMTASTSPSPSLRTQQD